MGMIPANQLGGAVLAGGESRRMGQDKATLLIDGVPLWRRQVSTLHAAGAVPVGVVRRPGQAPLGLPADVPLWQDAVVGAGPLAGLEAALAACPANWLAVLAIDMPGIDAGWFRWLATFCEPGAGAVAQHLGGAFEPLAAIYPKSAMTAVAASLHSEDRSLQALVRRLAAQRSLALVPLREQDTWRVANWNTPGDTSLIH